MRVISIKTRERVDLVAECRQLVGAFDHLHIVLLRGVSLVVQRINVIEERGIRILRYKIIQAFDQCRWSFLCRTRLVGVVLGHGVLGRSGVLARCRRLREGAPPAPGNQEKGGHHRQPRQSFCSVHSHFSSLKVQA